MPSMLIHFNHILSPGTDESCDICRQSAVSFIRTDDKELFERDIAKMATVHYAAGHGVDAEDLTPAPLEEIEIMWVDDNVPRFWATKTLRLNAEQHRRQFDHFYWNRESAVYCMYRTPSHKPMAPPVISSPAPAQEGVLAQTGHAALRSAASPSYSAFGGQPSRTAPQTGNQFSDLFSPGTFPQRDTNQQPQHMNVADRAHDGHGSKKASEPKPAHPANKNGSANLFHPQQPSQAWPQSQPSVSALGKPQQITGITTQTSKLQEAESFSMPCRRRSLQHTAGDQSLAAAFRAGQTLPQQQQHPLASSQHKAQQDPVITTSTTKGPPSKIRRPEVDDRNVKKLPRSGMRKSVPANNTFNMDDAPFRVTPAGSPQKVVQQQQHAESRHPLAAEPLYADADEPMRDASGCYDVFEGRSGWGCGN